MNRTKTMMLAAGSAVVLAIGAAACATAAPAPSPAAAAAASVADARRPAADTARDVGRKPAETIVFAGVRPGAKIAELNPGGGYYTRVLAGAVGPAGKIYAVTAPCRPDRPTCMDALNSIKAAYGNVEIIVADPVTYKTPEPVDLVWTTENWHDFHNGAAPNIPGITKNAADNLKPGGIFFIEDHSAAAGAGVAAAAHGGPTGRGRMDEAVVKTELTSAGFRLDAESNHLRNPSDDKNGPASDSGPSTSDRFAMRWKKPG